MSYLTAHRHGLVKVPLSDDEAAAGWKKAWEHPSGLRALKHPCTGRWHVSDGHRIVGDGFSSSLRAAAGRIERLTRPSASVS